MSSHLSFCLPFLSFPCTVPCKIVLLSQRTLRHGQTTLVSVSWPRLGVRHFPNGCLDLSADILTGGTVLVWDVQLPSVASHLKVCVHFSISGVKFHNLISLWMPLALFVVSFFSALISILYFVQVLSRLSTRASSSYSPSAKASMSSANRRLVMVLPPMLTFPSYSSGASDIILLTKIVLNHSRLLPFIWTALIALLYRNKICIDIVFPHGGT